LNSRVLSEHQVSGNVGALLDFALGYARRGWSIIPVTGKEAVTLWKPFQTRQPDEKTLRRPFAKKGITGLAVILGSPSGGLAVRDFDQVDAYEDWASANPEDAALLPTVKTARGYHVYGRLDNEAFENLDDGELRADSGHYVVLPPSVHPDGAIYSWLNPLPEIGVDLPMLPSSLLVKREKDVTQEHRREDSREPNTTHEYPISCVTSAIARTLPTGPGQRRRCLFDLARHLKRIIPEASRDELRRIVRAWHIQAHPFIRTKQFDESWIDFSEAWELIRLPAGCCFDAAAKAADLDVPPSIAEKYDGNLRRLASLCRQLQRQWGKSPFPLGCQKAADFLGVSKFHAWSLLRTLQIDTIIVLKKLGSKKSKKASEFRYVEQ
jgi:hypothetical protein